MKKNIIITAIILIIALQAQSQETQYNGVSSGERLIQGDQNLKIGGYGHVDYNQALSADEVNTGKLDVHRLVLLMGYQFNKKTAVVTEIEFEHVQEVYVEQAYLNHKLNDWLNLRAGLLLVPMGIINEYHEPVLYNGVERPLLDNNLMPGTWREIGLGFTGRSNDLGLKYQAYLMNGILSYKNSGLLNSSGFRSGRQKGAESILSSPNFTGRLEFYGLPGIKIGASGWYGTTQSALYQGIDKADDFALEQADSSVVDMSMLGLDFQYHKKGFEAKFQYYLTAFNHSDIYNQFTGNNLAKIMTGFYLEAAYNLFQSTSREDKLIPFVRYTAFNTQAVMEGGFTADPTKKQELVTAGAGWFLTTGAVIKADYEWTIAGTHQLNMGIGFMF